MKNKNRQLRYNEKIYFYVDIYLFDRIIKAADAKIVDNEILLSGPDRNIK